MPILKAAKAIALTAALLCVSAPAFAATQISETVKLFYQAISSNQPELLDQVLAPIGRTFRSIRVRRPDATGSSCSTGFNKIFAELKVTNDDIIESGDKVVVRSTIEGTQAGDFAGFPSRAGRSRPWPSTSISSRTARSSRPGIEGWLGGLFQMGVFQK